MGSMVSMFPFLSAARVAALGLFLTLLPGCSTWFGKDFTAPKVQLVRVELVYARMLEQEFLLEFSVKNPNNRSLPIRGLSYNLTLNDIPLGHGQANQWLTVPAGGERRFSLRAHTNLWRHAKQVVAILKKPDQPIRYALDGELKTGLIFNKKVKVRRQGSITPGDFINDAY